jgi:uncharacterized membrane protein YebE (DUF533 family)
VGENEIGANIQFRKHKKHPAHDDSSLLLLRAIVAAHRSDGISSLSALKNNTKK